MAREWRAVERQATARARKGTLMSVLIRASGMLLAAATCATQHTTHKT